MIDRRSATVRLAETKATAAALAQRSDDVAQGIARMLEAQLPELERQAAAEAPPVEATAPTLIEQVHPGAVPRFSQAGQDHINSRPQINADDLLGETK
jgi:hypothetical protein